MLQSPSASTRVKMSRLAALERQVAAVREAMFDVTDTARDVIAPDQTELHVSLQRASNELGRVESLLRDAVD